MDRMVDGRWRPGYPKPEVEKAALRRIILAARPDILAVQEIGPEPFLREFHADLALDGLDYPHVWWMGAEDEDRHLAVLSRLPAVAVPHVDLDFAYLDGRARVKRGMLELIFQSPEGVAWKLFVVHLKSPWTDDPRDPGSAVRRTREAEACRDRIIARTFESGEPAFLIAGDFNDHPESAPMRRFHRRGDLVIGRRVPAFDSRGEIWTAFWEKESVYRAVDGFVASEAIFPRIAGAAARIADLPPALEGSDHRLVYLDLE